MENNLKKNIHVYIYTTEALCYIPETNTALQINYTLIKKNLSFPLSLIILLSSQKITTNARKSVEHKQICGWANQSNLKICHNQAFTSYKTHCSAFLHQLSKISKHSPHLLSPYFPALQAFWTGHLRHWEVKCHISHITNWWLLFLFNRREEHWIK